MRVFLGNTPWHEGDKKGVRAGSRWPHFVVDDKCRMIDGREILGYVPFPFFLAYAASILENAGHEVLLVDGIAEGMDDGEFMDKIIEFAPDMICTEVSTPTIQYDLNYAKHIRTKYTNDAIIVFVGPHGEFEKEEFLKKNQEVDYVLFGEYEYPLLEFVNALSLGSDLSSCGNLVYRDINDDVVITKRSALRDLNDFPRPAYHFLPMLNYYDGFCDIKTPSLQMNASRGCPYKCIYCLWPQTMYAGHSYRVIDPVKLVDELEWLVNKYGFKSVYFDDDTFNIGMRRVRKIADEIIARGIKIDIGLMCRADLWDQETLQRFKQAGLYAVKYGVESGVQELVDAAKKNLDLKKAKEGIRMTKELGVKVHLTFMFGLPGETKETIQKTIDFVMASDPDSVQFAYTIPFPGTSYFNIAKKTGFLQSEDWSDYSGDSVGALRTAELSTAELKEAATNATGIWGRHVQGKWIDQNYDLFKKRILSCLGDKPYKKILVFRSSFEAHAKNVAKVFAQHYVQAKVDMVLQENVKDEMQSISNVDKCYVYHGKEFTLQKFRECFKISSSDTFADKFRGYDLIVILFNQQPRSSYSELEKIAFFIDAPDVVGINYRGESSLIANPAAFVEEEKQ